MLRELTQDELHFVSGGEGTDWGEVVMGSLEGAMEGSVTGAITGGIATGVISGGTAAVGGALIGAAAGAAGGLIWGAWESYAEQNGSFGDPKPTCAGSAPSGN